MPVTTAPFKRGEKVRSTTDIAHLAEGTSGKVMLVNGFSWVRYWVAFEDGTEIGSIDQGDLVRAKEWDDFLKERAAAEAAAEAGEVEGETEEVADGAASGGTDGAVVNGVEIPGYLLQRSKDARARLGG